MGSSAKKKKEKKKDFQKTKLKVGKAKPKPSNFTDTSFKSKAIAVNQQSLSETAPDAVERFKHYLSLAATGSSDKQRRDALSFLTTQLASVPPNNPVGTREILTKLLPLVPNTSTPVRGQLLKLLRVLPASDVKNHAEDALRWVRVGMTNLSTDVSTDALGVLEWLLEVAPEETVSCPGGWVITLKGFGALLGWSKAGNSGWSSGPRSAAIRTKPGASHPKQIAALAKFLEAGLRPEGAVAEGPSQYWDTLYRLDRRRDPYAYMNIYSKRRDEDGEMYQDRESRQTVFEKRFLEFVAMVADNAKKEGGAAGRAAATLNKVIREGTGDGDAVVDIGTDDLLELW